MSKTSHKFDPTILREYDIRGVVGDTLHVSDALAIGLTHVRAQEAARLGLPTGAQI